MGIWRVTFLFCRVGCLGIAATHDEDGIVIEKQCEEVGYPNVTNDGELMYDNQFSTDINEVISWGRERIKIRIDDCKESINRLECDIKNKKDMLCNLNYQLTFFNKLYPESVDKSG